MLACDSLRNFNYVGKRSQSGVRIVQTEISFKNLTCEVVPENRTGS